MNSLVLRDVACLRGGRLLFEGLSLALEPGGAALVTGPNGAGKSSMIRVAAGLLAPAAGRVEGEGDRALLAETVALDPELPLGKALRVWAGLDGPRWRARWKPSGWRASTGSRCGCSRPVSAAAPRSPGWWRAARRSGCSTSPPTASTRHRCCCSRD